MALAALLGLVPGRAFGATPGEPAVLTEDPRVDILVSGDEAALSLTRASAQELFERLGVGVEVRGPNDDAPDAPVPFAVVNITFSATGFTIRIVEGESGAEIDERRVRESSSLETAVEAATHVAYMVVEAMLERRSTEPAPPTPAPTTRTDPAPIQPMSKPAADSEIAERPARRDSSSRVGFDAGALLSVMSLGGARVLPGAGLSGELYLPQSGLGAMLSLATHAETDLQSGAARASLRPTAARLHATWDMAVSESLLFALALGGGFDWLYLTPEQPAAGVETSASRSLIDPLLSGLAGMRVRLGQHAQLAALAGVDVSLSPSRFVAEVDGQRQVLLEMPLVRPLLLVTASASLSGSRFEARSGAP